MKVARLVKINTVRDLRALINKLSDNAYVMFVLKEELNVPLGTGVVLSEYDRKLDAEPGDVLIGV
jgi:hypothetical protein